MKKIIVFLTLFIIVFALIVYLSFRVLSNDVFIQSPIGTNTDEVSAQEPTSIKEYYQTKKAFSILIAGYAGGKHDGAYLTDTLIHVRIDPKAKKIVTVSIPRDTWIPIPQKGGNWKINAAYAFGLESGGFPSAALYAKNAVASITGQPVPYSIALDFSGFIKTIDTLGGVDIYVDPAFTDPEYPIEGNEAELCDHKPEDIPALDLLAATTSAELVFPCRYETLEFARGLQHMDGTTALKYVRSRHSLQDGSDFSRSKRQQKLVLAVKDRIFSIGFLPKLVPFLTSISNNVHTDMTPDDIKTLLEHAQELNTYTIDSLSLSDKNYLYQDKSDNGQQILSSIDGLNQWQSVRAWLQNTYEDLPIAPLPIVQIQNGTRTPGLGSLAWHQLKNKGLQLLPPINATERNVSNSTITLFASSISAQHIAILQRELHAQLTVSHDATPSGYNVLVILGNDYAQNTTPP